MRSPIPSSWEKPYSPTPHPWKYVIPERVWSFRTEDFVADIENYQPFGNLEHFGAPTGLPFYKFKLPSLHKLELVSGYKYDNDDVCGVYGCIKLKNFGHKYYITPFDWLYYWFYQYCKSHPELEHVTVGFFSWLTDAPNDAVFKLAKLRSFSCQRETISKGVHGETDPYRCWIKGHVFF